MNTQYGCAYSLFRYTFFFGKETTIATTHEYCLYFIKKLCTDHHSTEQGCFAGDVSEFHCALCETVVDIRSVLVFHMRCLLTSSIEFYCQLLDVNHELSRYEISEDRRQLFHSVVYFGSLFVLTFNCLVCFCVEFNQLPQCPSGELNSPSELYRRSSPIDYYRHHHYLWLLPSIHGYSPVNGFGT